MIPIDSVESAPMFEPGNGAKAPRNDDADADGEEDVPRSPGMLATSPEAAAHAERDAALAREKATGPDAPAVSEERMKELKTRARAQIQQRLDEKRKRRRLLRGNESDVHRTL
jgi:hypothetical protein